MYICKMKKLLLISCLLLLAVTAWTQGTVRGTVLDKETGEPIIYANVFIENTTLGANTDLDGFFTIPKVPEGEQKLLITYLGYDSIAVNINIEKGKVYNNQYYLSESTMQMDVVNISAEKDRARNEVKVSKLSISPQQINYLPATGGEPDIAQYLQVLPGIVSTGDAGGQIFIRGGSPVQNKILLDGLTIVNPFHSIGFFSTFETDAIRNVDVLTGAYNAEYSGRISAIVSINTREGNKTRFSGSVSASPFMGKIFVEGPIVKFDKSKGGSTSFMFSQKYSYIDQIGDKIYPYVKSFSGTGFPYKLNDTYGKLSFVNSNGSKLNLFGFNYNDQFNNPSIANIGWNNFGGGAKFSLILENSDLVLNGIVGYTAYKTQFLEENAKPRTSALNNFLGRIDFDYYLPNGAVNYGVELNVNRTDFSFWNTFGNHLKLFQNTTNASGYVKWRQKFFNGLIIEPGFRAIYYAALGEVSYEPRLGVKFIISDAIRLKAAAGRYSQSLLSTSNERDVINLFSGFLTSPEERVNILNTEEKTEHNLQKSWQAVAGVEVDLLSNLSLNLEGYLKEFTQLVVVNRNKLKNSDPNYVTERGDAYGVDLSLKYQLSNVYLWGTFSHSYVYRFDGEQKYSTLFDRRNNVNVMANYQFGDDDSWELGARWNYGSGFPFTKTQAFYTFLPFDNGGNTDVVTENPKDVGIIYSDKRNGGRLPDFHRLDLSIKKTIKFTKHSSLELLASATNVYNRNNIFYFDRVSFDRVDQLPILPNFSIKYKF